VAEVGNDPLIDCLQETLLAECLSLGGVHTVGADCCDVGDCEVRYDILECPLECEAETRCGERPGCYGGIHDGLLCRSLEDCVGGWKCVPLDKACRDDEPCQDCNEDEDDLREHQCTACRECDDDEFANEDEHAIVPCCPFGLEQRFIANMDGPGYDRLLELFPALKDEGVEREGRASVRYTYSPTGNGTAEVCLAAGVENFPLPAYLAIVVLEPPFGGVIDVIDMPLDELGCVTGEGTIDDILEQALGNVWYVLLDAPTDQTQAIAGPFGRYEDRGGGLRKPRPPKSDKCGEYETTLGGNCRPRLDCTCRNCVDECDFKLEPHTNTALPADFSGVQADDEGRDAFGLVMGFDLSQKLFLITGIDKDLCSALRAKSCALERNTYRRASVEPHAVLTRDELCAPATYDKRLYDTYRVHATERDLSVRLRRASELPIADARNLDGLEALVYAVRANDKKCEDAHVFRPQSYSSEWSALPVRHGYGPGGSTLEQEFRIRVPSAGYYIIVVSYVELKFTRNDTLIDLEDRQALRCVDYKIAVDWAQPECSIDLCGEFDVCHGPRDCDADPHHYAPCQYQCATDYGRCILAEPTDDPHRPPRYDDTHADGYYTPAKRPTRRRRKKTPICAYQPVGAPCLLVEEDATGLNPIGRECFIGECADDHTCEAVGSGGFDCDCACPRQCDNYLDCNDGNATTIDICDQATGVCIHRAAPPPSNETVVAAGPALVRGALELAERDDSVSAEAVAAALDAAELAYTAAAFDVFGARAANGERRAPLCNADVEQRTIEVSAARHAPAAECAAVDVAARCLDGAAAASASGHQWFDRAWRSLDRAARAAQASAGSRTALESACCAQTYYAALADWCGRRDGDSDYWSLAGAEVRRAALGADCVAFDDGHRDRDTNDWVAEQRVVEVWTGDALRAVNVHVVPLARGGGYRASYAVSVRGASVESVDRGANAACSERARALLADSFDPAAVAAELRARTEFAAGTSVGVFHHVLDAADAAAHALPVGVRDSRCVTLGADGPAYCGASARGDVALFDDLRSALPPAAAADALDALDGGVAAVDASTNTRRNTRRVQPRYGASAVIVPPAGLAGADARSLRFVLRNEDCGAAVVLPETRDGRVPLAVRVPADACAAWRWSDEGVALVEDPRAAEGVCRGGVDSGAGECGATDGAAQCASGGGECSVAPRAGGGVPYEFAHRYFTCAACRAADECATDAACAGHACCDERVQRWFEHANAALVYQPTRALRDAVFGADK